jgi:serine/threonine protein kinase
MIMDYSNVIRVYDFHLVPWEGSVLVFQSMEYAGGGTFRKWLAEHKADVETRRKTGLKFFKQACAGVRSIHQTGAFMLDLKPDNLLFCGDVIKVSDFGTAKFSETIGGRPIHLPDNGAPALGTAEYMSPEQFLAPHPDDIDLRSDIYSLGIILYELLHPKCHPPFDGSYQRLQKLHVQLRAPSLPQTAEKNGHIVARCLEKDPSERYQTVDELIAALEGESPPEIGMKKSFKTKKEQTTDIIRKTWENASRCYAKGKFNEAADLVDEILSAKSDHAQARRLKEELANRFAQAEGFYREISTISEGSLTEPIELLEEAISIYPDHPSGPLVQAKLAVRVRQYCIAMEEGLNALQKEHWETALAWYHKAFQLHPETPYLSQLIESLTQIKNYRIEMDAAIRQGNLDTALSLARLVDVRVEEMTARIPAFRQ